MAIRGTIGGMYQVSNPVLKAMQTSNRASTVKDEDEEERKKKAYKDRLKTGAIAGGVIGLAGAYLSG